LKTEKNKLVTYKNFNISYITILNVLFCLGNCPADKFCLISGPERKVCGHHALDKSLCELKGCCFDISQQPMCYYRYGMDGYRIV